MSELGWIITGWTIGPNSKLISTGYAPGYERIAQRITPTKERLENQTK